MKIHFMFHVVVIYVHGLHDCWIVTSIQLIHDDAMCELVTNEQHITRDTAEAASATAPAKRCTNVSIPNPAVQCSEFC